MSIKLETYKNFVIQLQGNGFRMSPTHSGSIASFWVVNKDSKVRSVFAFAIALLDSFESDGETEEKILSSAISIIKSYIDNNSIKDLDEYPFEYKSHQFIYDENAKWWNKSLKIIFKK